jgi:hypothetical protein
VKTVVVCARGFRVFCNLRLDVRCRWRRQTDAEKTVIVQGMDKSRLTLGILRIEMRKSSGHSRQKRYGREGDSKDRRGDGQGECVCVCECVFFVGDGIRYEAMSDSE